jgi:hypothetical protein
LRYINASGEIDNNHRQSEKALIKPIEKYRQNPCGHSINQTNKAVKTAGFPCPAEAIRTRRKHSQPEATGYERIPLTDLLA